MGKNLTAKTLPGDFQVTTPDTPLLSQQAVTSKGIPSTLPTYSWTLTPITQLDLFCSDSSPFWCTAPKYMTNSCADPSTWLQTLTKKIFGCKVLQFIHTMKIKKMLGHKTLRCKYIATSSRERDELGQELRLRSQFAWIEFSQCLCNLCTVWWLLKQSF